jgi:hypothetical protein
VASYRHFNKTWGVKPVLWTQTSPLIEMMHSCMSFPHVSITERTACYYREH